MNNKEMIERALGPIFEEHDWYWGGDRQNHIPTKELIDTLAEQAMVIECEVEHRDGDTSLFINESEDNVWLEGHHGTPGKALAIIIPLEGKDDLAS